MMMRNLPAAMRRLSAGGILLLLCGILAASGCDYDLNQPGRIEDDELSDQAMFTSLLNGMGRSYAEGLNFLAHRSAVVTREIHPAAPNQIFSVSPRTFRGELHPDEQNEPWNFLQQARWTAEAGIERMRETLGESEASSSEDLARAYLWAGYANRSLGANMCQAVIDEGAAQDNEAFLERSSNQFTEALEIAQAAGASEVQAAARAGRASVRILLGDWSGAVSDASEVATSFTWTVPYFETGDRSEWNRIATATANEPYKTLTTWGSVYEEYYEQSGDPRVAWTDTGLDVDGGEVACCGVMPFYRQQKFTEESDEIEISAGTEMRLIEAEAELVNDNRDAAIAIINELRTAAGADSVSASSMEEAWGHLKRERGIVLWLEGRRMEDLRRWEASETPGQLAPEEIPGDQSHLDQQDLCFPIPTDEVETNPNL